MSYASFCLISSQVSPVNLADKHITYKILDWDQVLELYNIVLLSLSQLVAGAFLYITKKTLKIMICVKRKLSEITKGCNIENEYQGL